MKLNIIPEVIRTHFTQTAHVYRQICATFAAALMSMSGGLVFGFTAMLLPQLANDNTFPYDKKYDSWIASISPLAMTMGCLFSGSMSDGLGRKKGQIILSFPFIIGWIIMGFANSNTVMLIGRFVTGICTGAIRPNTIVFIGEVAEPRFRATALLSPTLALHSGCLISHIIGKYVNWKVCCLLFTIPNVVTIVALLLLKESPLWLLTKGRLDEGIESFRLYRGTGESSEKELTTVLEKCKANQEPSFEHIKGTIFSKPFLKSITTSFLLFLAVQWCGINTLSFYAQQIFEKTFGGDIDAFLMTLGTDGIRLGAGVFVCIFATVIPQKKAFSICCFITTIVLAVLSICLHINPPGFLWLTMSCMIVYIAIASVLTSFSWSFIAEIFPSSVRGFGSGLSSGISFVLLFISVKATPAIMIKYGEAAMYAGCAMVTLVAGVLLIFMLPETGGKTLQDIENELYEKRSEVNNDVKVVTVL